MFIENVGNLVCPATYDLGEDLRLVLCSVTEGEDKPLKYPTIFHSADLAVLTKMDLAEAVEFDLAAARRNIQAVHLGSPSSPDVEVTQITDHLPAVANDARLRGVTSMAFPDGFRARSERAPTGPRNTSECVIFAHVGAASRWHKPRHAFGTESAPC